MTPITNKELMDMSLLPVKRAIKRMYMKWQLKWLDRHMDVINREISNGHRALSILSKDRANLLNRLRGL